MEESKLLDRETFTKLLHIQRNASTKVQIELQRIFTAPQILDQNGQPPADAKAKIRDRVKEYLSSLTVLPTTLQHLDNPELENITNIGASFEVAHILGVVVVSTLMKMQNIPLDMAQEIMYLVLIEVASPSGRGTLYDVLDNYIKLEPRDPQGNLILDPEFPKKKQAVLISIIQVMVSMLEANGLVDVLDNNGQKELQITSSGVQTINHLAAVDMILSVMETSNLVVANAEKQAKTE